MLANKAIIVKIDKDVLLFLFQKKIVRLKSFRYICLDLFRLPSQKDKKNYVCIKYREQETTWKLILLRVGCAVTKEDEMYI